MLGPRSDVKRDRSSTRRGDVMAEPRTRIELSNGESFTTSESLETVERMITVSLAGTGFFAYPRSRGIASSTPLRSLRSGSRREAVRRRSSREAEPRDADPARTRANEAERMGNLRRNEHPEGWSGAQPLTFGALEACGAPACRGGVLPFRWERPKGAPAAPARGGKPEGGGSRESRSTGLRCSPGGGPMPASPYRVALSRTRGLWSTNRASGATPPPLAARLCLSTRCQRT